MAYILQYFREKFIRLYLKKVRISRTTYNAHQCQPLATARFSSSMSYMCQKIRVSYQFGLSFNHASVKCAASSMRDMQQVVWRFHISLTISLLQTILSETGSRIDCVSVNTWCNIHRFDTIAQYAIIPRSISNACETICACNIQMQNLSRATCAGRHLN